MGTERISETLRLLEEARARTSEVLVGFSGGKDSLIVLDLCKRVFDRVEAFHMELVPGLRCIEEALTEAEQRWQVPIHRVPHWVLARMLRGGVYCDPPAIHKALPELKLNDIYAIARDKAQIGLIASGARRADSQWRKRNLAIVDRDATRKGAYVDVLYPIVGWSRADVFAYLKRRDIPVPESSGKSATGVDLTVPSLTWLHDTYPDDFARLREVFPYIDAAVFRRDHFGVT